MTQKNDRARKFNPVAKSERTRNFVAKYAHKFNRAERLTPEKLKQKQGYRKHKKEWTLDESV
jgi:hypothetical protein